MIILEFLWKSMLSFYNMLNVTQMGIFPFTWGEFLIGMIVISILMELAILIIEPAVFPSKSYTGTHDKIEKLDINVSKRDKTQRLLK